MTIYLQHLHYPSNNQADDIGDARVWIAALRAENTARRERIPLSALPGWALRPEGVIAEDPAAGEFAVRYFAVRALDREVPEWCQPLVDSRGMGTVGMIAQRREGVLKFLVRMVHEPADVSGGLLVATVHCSPGHTHEADPHALAGAQDVDTTGAIAAGST